MCIRDSHDPTKVKTYPFDVPPPMEPYAVDHENKAFQKQVSRPLPSDTVRCPRSDAPSRIRRSACPPDPLLTPNVV
eukprot:6993114-Pyramimonas_sp.AAC.1